MRYSPFADNLKEFRSANDGVMVKDILLSEISDAVVNRREQVIDAINRSGMYIESSTTASDLSKIITDNLDNKKFVRGLSSVIALKTPDDFSSFSSANGNKITQEDYKKDVYLSVDGNIKSEDKDSLSEKVDKLLQSLGLKTNDRSGVRGACITVGILSVSAAAIYFIAIRPMVKGKVSLNKLAS